MGSVYLIAMEAVPLPAAGPTLTQPVVGQTHDWMARHDFFVALTTGAPTRVCKFLAALVASHPKRPGPCLGS